MRMVLFLLNKTPSTLEYTEFWVSTIMLVRLAHSENAHSLIEITLEGMVTLVRLVQL